ncbi:MAG: outer membrane beta-barrel protein [Nitrospirota bacterium]
MKTLRSVLWGIAVTLMLAAPVLAQEEAPPENRSGVHVKVGVDAPGTHRVENGSSISTDVDGGGFLSGELYATINPHVELGAGVELPNARSPENSSGEFIFIPIYGVARLYPLVGPVAPYVVGRIGMSLFLGDDDYKGNGDLESGAHLGIGAGIDIHRIQIEAMLSVSTGRAEVGPTWVDVSYSKLGVSMGYRF